MCLPWLEVVFRIYGIDTVMNKIANISPALPYIITVIIALCFALCGIYAISACGKVRKMPFLKVGIYVIIAVFLFRAVVGTADIVCHSAYTFTKISSVAVALVIGVLSLYGMVYQYCPRTND